jgi:hypothetical protein
LTFVGQVAKPAERSLEALHMAAIPSRPDSTALRPSLEERLERGEVEYYPICPFPLLEGEERTFLLKQRLASRAHKNISYDPHTLKAAGFLRESNSQAERLRMLLAAFSETATTWLATMLPRYAASWKLDKVSFRPEEEATRKLRHKARNDLLHVDAFPSRPTNGHRILRLFVNVNLTEPRIWVTSDNFARLLERFGKEAGLPTRQSVAWGQQIGRRVLRLFQPNRRQRSVYDEFMLRFHDFLKANELFQERGPKHFWTFVPGSAWLAFTDAASHAVLRGRYALEHSYFVSPQGLALPQESPPALLERACGMTVLNQAA